MIGALLLDMDGPFLVLSRTRNDILKPGGSRELTGQVPNVVFPSGLIVERTTRDGFAKPDSRVWGDDETADTCNGRAETMTGELVDACSEH